MNCSRNLTEADDDESGHPMGAALPAFKSGIMTFGLKDKTIKQIQSVLAGYPQVEKAVLYGSRAKGNYRNGSDIDMTLYGGDSEKR